MSANIGWRTKLRFRIAMGYAYKMTTFIYLWAICTLTTFVLFASAVAIHSMFGVIGIGMYSMSVSFLAILLVEKLEK
jgi:hypothetical protein